MRPFLGRARASIEADLQGTVRRVTARGLLELHGNQFKVDVQEQPPNFVRRLAHGPLGSGEPDLPIIGAFELAIQGLDWSWVIIEPEGPPSYLSSLRTLAHLSAQRGRAGLAFVGLRGKAMAAPVGPARAGGTEIWAHAQGRSHRSRGLARIRGHRAGHERDAGRHQTLPRRADAYARGHLPRPEKRLDRLAPRRGRTARWRSQGAPGRRDGGHGTDDFRDLGLRGR